MAALEGWIHSINLTQSMYGRWEIEIRLTGTAPPVELLDLIRSGVPVSLEISERRTTTAATTPSSRSVRRFVFD